MHVYRRDLKICRGLKALKRLMMVEWLPVDEKQAKPVNQEKFAIAQRLPRVE